MELWTTLLAFVLLTCLHPGLSQDFGYNEENGPSHWGEKFAGCVGKHQSPIDIADNKVKLIKLGDVTFNNFLEIPENASITNNGHTVMIQLKGKKLPEVTGGPLKGIYKFSQLHFHWGENDQEGSENTINNHSFPMELHMVFYKTEYGNAGEAMLYPDGLTVLAFLYKISKRNNSNYDNIVDALKEVIEPETSASILKMPHLNSILMLNRKQYFTYDGSLTTPPCSEVVIWIEFKNPISLSHKQLDEFRALNNEDGKMTHNFRPTQPLHDRTIYYNQGEDIDDWSDNKINPRPMKKLSNKSKSNRFTINLILISFNVSLLYMFHLISYFL